MKAGRDFFYLCIRASFSGFFCLLGIAALLFPLTDRNYFIDTTLLVFLGCALLIFGYFLGRPLLKDSHLRYFFLNRENNPVAISETIFLHYLEAYLGLKSPKNKVKVDLILNQKKIRIFAQFSSIARGEQKRFLDDVKKDIEKIFSEKIGYNGKILLTARFRS